MASIKRAADLYAPQRPEDPPYTGASTILEMKRRGGFYLPDPEPAQGGDPAVLARVDHGRWIGDCDLPDPSDAEPERICRNAQALDPDDPRYFCVACANAAVSGRWRPVTWPPDPAAVEAPLEGLPADEQNWTPEG